MVITHRFHILFHTAVMHELNSVRLGERSWNKGGCLRVQFPEPSKPSKEPEQQKDVDMSPERKPEEVWNEMWQNRCNARRQQELAQEQSDRSGQFDKLTRAEAFVETVLAPPGKTPQQCWKVRIGVMRGDCLLCLLQTSC